MCYNHSMNYEFLSILIIEDDEKTRDYLRDILSIYFKSVYVAQDGCVGFKLFKEYLPDIVISDIKMPCMDGLEVLKNSKMIKPDTIAIVCTAFSNKEYLMSAIDIKIDGYIVKPIEISVLLDRIKLNISDRSVSNSQKHTILSSREYEVFLDIALGIKPVEIAEKFGIKPKTVGTYRKRILEKMNFSSNADIIAYAIKNNLI